MYGHVITKFSGMGSFTYPWCSAGALGAPELHYKASVFETEIEWNPFSDNSLLIVTNHASKLQPYDHPVYTTKHNNH